jgi:hypothetical protein
MPLCLRIATIFMHTFAEILVLDRLPQRLTGWSRFSGRKHTGASAKAGSPK